MILGMECRKLGGIDDDSPWQMTVDIFEDGVIRRYQLIGRDYNAWLGAPERTVEDVAQGTGCAGITAAEQLDRLDREYAEKLAPITDELFREQVRVLHGDEMVERLDAG